MRLRLLVVDDEPGVRALVKGVLARKEGIEVIEARDGAEALKILLEGHIDLLLLDLIMPVMGGLEVLRTIRSNPPLSSIAVLVLTGQADAERIGEAIRLDIQGCLAKPFSVSDLRDRVESLMTMLRRPDGSVRRAAVRLSLAPTDRVLVVDQSSDVCKLAQQVLGRVCLVETEHNEFSALTRCRNEGFQAVVLGLLTDWSDPEGVSRRFRQLSTLRETPLVVMAPPSELEAIDAADRFDAVVTRRLDSADFEEAVAPTLDAATRSRLLFHPDSEWLASTFDSFAGIMTSAFGAIPRLVPGAGLRPSSPWIFVDTELHGPHMDKIICVRCPMESALALARRSETPLDEVSEMHARQAVSDLAHHLAERVVRRTADAGIRCELGQQRAEVHGVPGSRSTGDITRGVAYRFVTDPSELGVVEIAPSAPH